MATDNYHNDPLLNPAVDYDRTDLSPRGILLFLLGLLVAGIFIELVIWGMFRFLSHSTLFAQGNPNPMVSAEKLPAETKAGVKMQNAPQTSVESFPEPRLQTDDVKDMKELLNSEHKILYPEQPFADKGGNIHIPITDAMKLIEQRGLPVRPNAPPPDFAAPAMAGNAKITQKAGQAYAQPSAGPSHGAKPGPGRQPKQ
jgi:hypothetical protein